MANGKVIASYQVRVTLRDSAPPEVQETEPFVPPTNDRLAAVIGAALVGALDLTEDDVSVTSERLDR